jgi:hypothetical protein
MTNKQSISDSKPHENIVSKTDTLVLVLYFMMGSFAILMLGHLMMTVLPSTHHGVFSKVMWLLMTVVFDSFALLQPLITCYKITVSEVYLDYKWTFVPFSKRYEKSKIKGYISIELPSRQATYLTYYPVLGNKLLPSISSFTLTNAKEVIEGTGFTSLGKIPFSWKFYGLYIFLRLPLPG